MKKGILLIFLFAAMASCTMPIPKGKASSSYYADSTTTENATVSPASIGTPEQNWSYSQETDKMTSAPIYFASCDATNLLDFSSPYDGGSRLAILVRKMNGQNEVILQISKGQFNSAYNSDVKIKFDDGKILSYEFTEAADGSSDYIFLHPASSIIKKLKNAKKVKIEAPFFEQGNQVAEFNVDGLEWKH